MAEDTPPSSPPLVSTTGSSTVAIPTTLSSPKSPKLPPRRKRPRLAEDHNDQGYASASSSYRGELSSNSSDAPFFSSDDLTDADARNYASPARKKQYRRAWYEPERAESAVSHRLMRSETRMPKDSGIYMNSDSSNSSSSDGFDLEVAALKTKATQTQSKQMQAFLQGNEGSPTVTSMPSSQLKPPSTPLKSRVEQLVEQYIGHALEYSKEEVDLSGLDLEALPPECFADLHTFVKQPAFHPGKFADAACAPLTPSLKIFLGNNQLSVVPPSLFDLQYLEVLSLRNNHITELPAAIGRLRNLVELNLSGNPLHSLPFEILPLINKNSSPLHRSVPHPSLKLHATGYFTTFGPFVQDPRHQVLQTAKADTRIPERTEFMTIFGRTPPALFEADGTLARCSPIPAPSQLCSKEAIASHTDALLASMQPGSAPPAVEPRPPSLFDLALTKAVSVLPPAEIQSLLPSDLSPNITAALERATRVIELEGPAGRVCSAWWAGEVPFMAVDEEGV
ncbi:MAG: hypothetical protein Q9162_002214 [Coniocarpon cinnabarinum]